MKYIFILLFFFISLSYCNNLKKVNLQLQWKYQFQFAGFIMAKEKSYYKDIGLDVNIIEYNKDINTLKDLLSNKIEYSILNTPFIYKNRKIQETVLLASYFQRNPLVFLVRPDITNPSHLKNKKIMGTHDDLVNSSLALMLNHFEINTSNSTFKAQTFNMNDFIEKKVDAVTAFKSNELFELDKKKVKYNILDPYDYGFFTTATNLFTTKEYASKNSEEVKQFIEATKKGWKYALNNVHEVSKLINSKYNKSRSIESLEYEAKITKELMLTKLYEIGGINDNLIHRAYKQLVKTNILLDNQDLSTSTLKGLLRNKYEQKVNFTKDEIKYLNNKKQITMCIDPNWLPFEKFDKNSNHIGMSADYFKLFKKQLNIPINVIKTRTWNESLNFVKLGKCDILSLAMKTSKRNEYLNFTSEYLEIPLVIATKTKVPFVNKIESIKDKKVAITKGYAFLEILKGEYPNLNIIDVENIEEGLEKVKNDEVFGYIGTLASIGHKFQTKFNGELKIAGKFDNKWKLGVAVRKEDSFLLSIFEKLVSSIEEEQQQKILNNWIAISYEKRIDYDLIFEILIISIIVILIFFYWNRKLFNTNKKLESAKEDIEKHLMLINENVLISISDRNGVIIDVSDALCRITGYNKEELIGRSHNIFRHKDMDESSFKDLWETLLRGDIWKGEVKNLNKNGSFYWADVVISPIYDESKKLKGYSAIRQNITDKKNLEKISVTDPLTNISNRLYLDKNYEYESIRTKRYKKELSLILIDIDFFKRINDKYGHNTGDIILIEIANILKSNIRSTDKLGRWGGEEFLIICPETNVVNAEVLAENLRAKINKHIFSPITKVTCSFGVTKYYADDKGVLEILCQSDKIILRIDTDGRNRKRTI